MKWEYATKRGNKLSWYTVTADTENEAQSKARERAKEDRERIYAGVLKK